MRWLGCVALLVGVGCLADTGAYRTLDGGSGESGTDSVGNVEDVGALVYASSSVSGLGGAYYFYRLGEEPVLLGESNESHVDLICLMPGGSGFVRWWPRANFGNSAIRVESLSVQDNEVEVGPSPFPQEFYPIGCPMGWSETAYFVNLAQGGPTEAGTARPYRALPDGTVHPLLEASGSWLARGDYAWERTQARTVLWNVRGAVRRLFLARQATEVTATNAPWIVLRSDDRGVELVSPDDPTVAPIELVNVDDAIEPPRLGFSPSGGFVSLIFDDRRLGDSVELVRIDGGEIVARRRFPLVDTRIEAYPTDAGHLVVFGKDEVWAAGSEEDPREIVAGSGSVVRLSQGGDVLVVQRNEDETRPVVHDLLDGSSRTFRVADSCELLKLVGEHAYFACGHSFGRVALRVDDLEFDLLVDEAGDDELILSNVVPLDWNRETWHSLSFLGDGGDAFSGAFLLLREDGSRAVRLGAPGTSTELVRFLPAPESGG